MNHHGCHVLVAIVCVCVCVCVFVCLCVQLQTDLTSLRSAVYRLVIVKNVTSLSFGVAHLYFVLRWILKQFRIFNCQEVLNPLNAELNPICHLLTLLGAHHILHVSMMRIKECGA
jgi:hypothetical protein